MAEPWWIGFFVYLFTDRCMQSWNAAFVFWAIRWGGIWGSGRVWAVNLTVQVGSDDLGYGL